MKSPILILLLLVGLYFAYTKLIKPKMTAGDAEKKFGLEGE